jgi:hypothetical protein
MGHTIATYRCQSLTRDISFEISSLYPHSLNATSVVMPWWWSIDGRTFYHVTCSQLYYDHLIYNNIAITAFQSSFRAHSMSRSDRWALSGQVMTLQPDGLPSQVWPMGLVDIGRHAEKTETTEQEWILKHGHVTAIPQTLAATLALVDDDPLVAYGYSRSHQGRSSFYGKSHEWFHIGMPYPGIIPILKAHGIPVDHPKSLFTYFSPRCYYDNQREGSQAYAMSPTIPHDGGRWISHLHYPPWILIARLVSESKSGGTGSGGPSPTERTKLQLAGLSDAFWILDVARQRMASIALPDAIDKHGNKTNWSLNCDFIDAFSKAWICPAQHVT